MNPVCCGKDAVWVDISPRLQYWYCRECKNEVGMTNALPDSVEVVWPNIPPPDYINMVPPTSSMEVFPVAQDEEDLLKAIQDADEFFKRIGPVPDDQF